MYEVNINKDNKIFTVVAGGYFKPEEANAFMKEYTEKKNSINPGEYSVVLQDNELKVSNEEMVPILSGILKQYIADGFKKIYLLPMKSAVALGQLRKLFATQMLQGKVVEINSIDEIK